MLKYNCLGIFLARVLLYNIAVTFVNIFWLNLEKNYFSMRRKNQYKEEFWTLLPAKAMVLNGLDAHSINEMKKGYDGVVVE